MRKRKTKRNIPDPLTPEESERLLSIPNKRYPTGIRNYVMIRLMLSLGLRCAEVLALRIQDVDLVSGRLKVNLGKGQKDRILWLNAELLSDLQLWRERRDRRKIESEYYFTTLKGEALDSRYIRAMMARYKQRAGIVRKCSAHTLRHTFATELLKETGNIEIVRKALGHSDINTTAIYLHATDGEMENALKTFQRSVPK
jgi:site-specific recombinase XerD